MKFIPFAMLAVLASFHSPRVAAASEWGCRVLLCAATPAPGWRAVASCHPPMERLISAMKQPGFSWPTCPEGGAGRPGYEEFGKCPAGWTVAAAEALGNGLHRPKLSRCMRRIDQCQPRWSGFGSSGCRPVEFMDRPRRQQPYFFDVKDPSTKANSRFYFDLDR